MVVKPRELEQRIKAKEGPAMQQFEATVDEELTRRFAGRGQGVSVGVPRGIRRFVLDQVLDKYRQAGWNVQIVYDQRDGDYIEFKEAGGDYQGPYGRGADQLDR